MTLSFMSSGANDHAPAIIRKLRSLRDDESSLALKRDFAVHHLKTATSAAIRNAAALALSDLKAADSVPAIISVVMKPGVADAAGTLLFAVEELGGDLPLETFVHVIVEGSYEARQQALDLLFDHRVVERDPGLIEHRLAPLEQLLPTPIDEARAADAGLALAFLRAGPEAVGA